MTQTIDRIQTVSSELTKDKDTASREIIRRFVGCVYVPVLVDFTSNIEQ